MLSKLGANLTINCMKKSDKIAGVVSVIVIICTIFYLFKSKIIFIVDSKDLYIVGALFLFIFFAIFQHYIIIGLILRGRAKAFNILANKYSLKHSYKKELFLIPYGKLNTLTGKINGHDVEITDDSFLPGMGKVVKLTLLNQIFPGYTPRKSMNMDTKIYIDGQNLTPDYLQSWILWRNPFMKISEIKSYLGKL